ncbi:MAG: type II secretion system protein [Parcubacteria group bacterium]
MLLKTSKGFTFIEILIAMGIFAIIVALVLPIGINFLSSNDLSTEYDLFLALIRDTRTQAITNQYDSSHGLYIDAENENYVLFTGDSFAGRNQDLDREFPISPNITLSGNDEIVFIRLTGATSSSSFTLTDNNKSFTIRANETGNIY